MGERLGKVTAVDGTRGEYLVMIGSKNHRFKEDQLSRPTAKKTKKSNLSRNKKPIEKKTI